MSELVFRGRRRPILIWIAPPLLVVVSVCDLLFILLMLLEAGDAGVTVLEQPVTAPKLWFGVAPALVSLVSLQLVLAYGLLTERAWARPLAVALPLAWLVIPALLLPPMISPAAVAAGVAVPAVLGSVVAALYLYGSRAARGYYERLASNGSERQ